MKKLLRLSTVRSFKFFLTVIAKYDLDRDAYNDYFDDRSTK
jgi:hypothetical protein